MKWQPISTAPKDGTAIRIRGRRFKTETRYTALAVFTKRRCPLVEVEDWFPATDTHDGAGPYEAVDSWRPAGTGG